MNSLRIAHLDSILLAAMESDVEMINEIQQLGDNGWFVTPRNEPLQTAMVWNFLHFTFIPYSSYSLSV